MEFNVNHPILLSWPVVILYVIGQSIFFMQKPGDGLR